jgi:hypothetical protein
MRSHLVLVPSSNGRQLDLKHPHLPLAQALTRAADYQALLPAGGV